MQTCNHTHAWMSWWTCSETDWLTTAAWNSARKRAEFAMVNFCRLPLPQDHQPRMGYRPVASLENIEKYCSSPADASGRHHPGLHRFRWWRFSDGKEYWNIPSSKIHFEIRVKKLTRTSPTVYFDLLTDIDTTVMSCCSSNVMETLGMWKTHISLIWRYGITLIFPLSQFRL